MKSTDHSRQRRHARSNPNRRTRHRLEVERLEDRTVPSNVIVTENQLPGTPESVWGVSGAGDASIQGFATDISVDQGQTISFKINDSANAPYHIDIYRLGYYGGNGARLVTTIPSSQMLRQVQPNPLTNAATGLVDAGNWAVSASWAVPATATSGLYFARPTRDDTGGASHHLLRRPRRRRRLGPPVPDRRHHLAGLQQLGRQQPLRRPTRPTAPRLQGQLQPARSSSTAPAAAWATTTRRCTPSTR